MALKASLIVSEMSSNVSSSSSTSLLVTIGELPFPAHNNDQPSPEVKERGGSSLSVCEICLERMESDHLVKNHGSVQAFCFNCSKTIELSKKEYFSERLSIQSNSGNYSTESSTSTATNNPFVHVNTEQRTDVITLNPADIDDSEPATYERKDECGAEKLEGAQSPQLMEEKLLVKETCAVPACEMSGKWKGLKQKDKDNEIVRPRMVVVRNTCLKIDANDMWVCMTYEVLQDYKNQTAQSKKNKGKERKKLLLQHMMSQEGPVAGAAGTLSIG